MSEQPDRSGAGGAPRILTPQSPTPHSPTNQSPTTQSPTEESPATQARGPASSGRVVLAGTAGGVGTTTVAALLFAVLRDAPSGAPLLLDHTAGDLGRRLPEGDEARLLDESYAVHDLGPHADQAGLQVLSESDTRLVVVTGATPVGLGLAVGTVERIHARFGDQGLQRSILVVSGAVGAGRGDGRRAMRRRLDQLRVSTALAGVLAVPADTALAAGGRIPTARLRPRTRSAAEELQTLLSSHQQPQTWSWWSPDRAADPRPDRPA